MLTLGGLAFAAPWMLVALLALPVLWWLLRVAPPAPRRIAFPAVRLLLGLTTTEQTPARTPFWLLILRLALAALVIIALAQPLINPSARLAGSGPLLLVIDDGWAAASRWQHRLDTLSDLLAQAERGERSVVLLTTAPPATGDPVRVTQLMLADEARDWIGSLDAKPWPVDRAAALAALDQLPMSAPAEVVWLSDGVTEGEDDAARRLSERLERLGPTQIIIDAPASAPLLLAPPEAERTALTGRAERPAPGAERRHWLRASDEAGELMVRTELNFAAGERSAEATIEAPVEIRNKIMRLDIEGEHTAGAVVLLDERWRRRPVGLVSGAALEAAQPLLSDLYYLERAITPFADVRAGSIGELLARELAVLMLADIGQVIGPERAELDEWLDDGGMLVRFAGPKLAENVDDLIPIELRTGGRSLGGALSWTEPARLAPFPPTSPFFGLAIPDEVFIERQVLAEPSLDLGLKTWARLADGTPLVTAAQRGRGWIVLFHVTANTDWSNLPLSGLFVNMLKRMVSLSEGVPGDSGTAPLPAFASLDGYGRLGDPPPSARPLAPDQLAQVRASPAHPPGFFGGEDARHALNLSAHIERLSPLPPLPDGIATGSYAKVEEIDLEPWLLALAIVLGLVDLGTSYWLRGLIPLGIRRASAAVLLVGTIGLSATGPAQAQETSDQFALMATLETHLAYVRTDIDEIDRLSHAGLRGLSMVLTRRTSVEPGIPVGVDLEVDELAFFPLIYWPVDARQADLSTTALAKIDTFMKNGGTILFDTRDQGIAIPGARDDSTGGPGLQRLREILGQLNIPPLQTVPEGHVLAKAFYLLQEFPGRWAGGQLWVERHGRDVNDGVSSILIGSSDWAAAWAVDEDGLPIAAVIPGGEQQREMAYRFGVNLVMYALTGNYKSDQVHVPAILERLGQ